MIDIPIQNIDHSITGWFPTEPDVLCISARSSHIALQDRNESRANRLGGRESESESESVRGGPGRG